MRVVVDTDSQLVLAHRPRVMPALLGLAVLAGTVAVATSLPTLRPGDIVGSVLGLAVGALMTWLTALHSEVVFDGPRREVRWQHLGWPGAARGRCPLEDVSSVQVVTDTHGEGGAQRVMLVTTGGNVPLTRHFSGIEPHERTATAIREWLARRRAAVR